MAQQIGHPPGKERSVGEVDLQAQQLREAITSGWRGRLIYAQAVQGVQRPPGERGNLRKDLGLMQAILQRTNCDPCRADKEGKVISSMDAC
jgi:hypothetical protein